MKKKTVCTLVVIALIMGILNLKFDCNNGNNFSLLADLNIEALADPEPGSGEIKLFACYDNIESPTEDEYYFYPHHYAIVTACNPCGVLAIVKRASGNSYCLKAY